VLPHYKTRRSSLHGVRHYLVEGYELPSVTSILSATEPAENVERLRAWQQRTPDHEQIRNEASARGSRLHKRLEDHLMGQRQLTLLEAVTAASPADVEHERLWEALGPFVQSIAEVALIEAPLWWIDIDNGNHYAGAVDLVARMHGDEAWAIVDLKTSRKYRTEKTWWGKAFTQLAAYQQAAEQVYKAHGLQIGKAMVVNVDVQRFKLQLHKAEGDELETYGEIWNSRLEAFYEQRG